jgi:hypothetical protein
MVLLTGPVEEKIVVLGTCRQRSGASPVLLQATLWSWKHNANHDLSLGLTLTLTQED